MNTLLLTLVALTSPAPDNLTPARRAAAPVPVVVVTFKPSAQVGGRTIHLGDIATVETPSEKATRLLEAVEVGAAPISAYPRTVSADYVKVRVRASGIDTDRILFTGSLSTEVKRLDQTVNGAALEKAVRDAVEQAYPGQSAAIAVAAREIRLPLGSVELKPQVPALTEGSSSTVNVQLLVDGKAEATAALSVRLLRKSPVVVAVRDIPAGTTLTEADIQIEERAVSFGPATYSDPGAVLGQQAYQPIKAGTVLSPTLVRPAMVVKRGSRLIILSRGASFTVSAAGEALQDGAVGQIIRIRNATSLLELTARVTGPDQVEVAH